MTRGGKRKGAGRKPMPDKKQTYATRLRPDQIAWLRSQKNAAKEIETALDRHIEENRGKSWMIKSKFKTEQKD